MGLDWRLLSGQEYVMARFFFFLKKKLFNITILLSFLLSSYHSAKIALVYVYLQHRHTIKGSSAVWWVLGLEEGTHIDMQSAWLSFRKAKSILITADTITMISPTNVPQHFTRETCTPPMREWEADEPAGGISHGARACAAHLTRIKYALRLKYTDVANPG